MESTVQTLLGTVGQLLREEYRTLHDVGRGVTDLRDELATMNALLRMQSEAEPGTMDHFDRECMKQVRELAFDAEDCVDEFMFNISYKSRRKDRVVARWTHLIGTIHLRRRLALEIRDLRSRAIDMSERHARYRPNNGVQRTFTSSPTTFVASVNENGRFSTEHRRIIGIADEADTLVKMLKTEVNGERHLKVFSFVGFGGLGKTTLAKEVCRQLAAEFPHQAMVSMSQSFDPGRDLNGLLKRLLHEMGTAKAADENGVVEKGTIEDIDGLDDNILAAKIKQFLGSMRCLIVFDDISTVREWQAIQPILPENNSDSRIIVTTRMSRVAEACGDYIFHVCPLRLEDSKKLFASIACGFIDDIPLELEDIAMKIIQRCCGIPLAIATIAAALAGYRSPGNSDVWERVYRSIDYKKMENATVHGILEVLTLSYNYLPYEIKSCMMYLSIFPANYEINKDRLLCRWIAEGLIPEKWGLTQKEVAESYLAELMSRNMIEPVSFGYGGRMESCRVHHMILEVILSKSLEAYFVTLIGGQHKGMSYDRVRRLSIQGGDRILPAAQVIDVKHVRSLSVFQLQGHKLLDRLDEFTLLRVLDLEDCEGVTNKNVVLACRLYLLKFLNLKGTNISVVPPQVGKLEHLQVFDTRDTCLDGLPETVTKLEKLERLLFSNRHERNTMWRLPGGIRKMKALHEVSLAILENDMQVAREVGELQQLQHLCITIDGKTDEEVLQELARSLSKTYSLEHLDIGYKVYGESSVPGTLNFLHNLTEPPRLLRYLRIAGAIGGSLPTWISSLTYLVEFSLSWADLGGDQLFDVLCKLPNLKSICVEQRCYSDKKLVAKTSHHFSSLICLKVISDAAWPKTLEFQKGSMRNLETLIINFSDKMKKILGIEHLTNLREVQLTGKKYQSALDDALKQLTAESKNRGSKPGENGFKVVVEYN